MRFLADEGMERAIVEDLRSAGHDVVWVLETARGADDTQVIMFAIQEQRLLITIGTMASPPLSGDGETPSYLMCPAHWGMWG